MVQRKVTAGKKTVYHIYVDREGVRVSFDEHFFDNTIVREDGTSQIDINIVSLVQEIRTALYYIATDGLAKH